LIKARPFHVPVVFRVSRDQQSFNRAVINANVKDAE
jgi:hypothetical protein